IVGQAVRRFTTSAVRSLHYAKGPRQNLPFSGNQVSCLIVNDGVGLF
uniref:Cytochrome c oxidase subunit 7C, mitochondrial n=1 Tax=Periophthalmus magnuspinnatus TaxID=409849 RepID=A0A3B4AI28_9GOBI